MENRARFKKLRTAKFSVCRFGTAPYLSPVLFIRRSKTTLEKSAASIFNPEFQASFIKENGKNRAH